MNDFYKLSKDPQPLDPIPKQRLSDGLALRVKRLIQERGFKPGDRLPSISEMTTRFGVGQATLREALKKLETLGIVSVKHGSGIYVSKSPDALLISNPINDGILTKSLLMDLTETRLLIETKAAELAARNATEEDLEQIREALREEEISRSGQPGVGKSKPMLFHRAVAAASGNVVLSQILEVISDLFESEQAMVFRIYSSKYNDQVEHQKIFEAIEAKDETLAAERMKTHLQDVRDILLQWNPGRDNDSSHT